MKIICNRTNTCDATACDHARKHNKTNYCPTLTRPCMAFNRGAKSPQKGCCIRIGVQSQIVLSRTKCEIRLYKQYSSNPYHQIEIIKICIPRHKECHKKQTTKTLTDDLLDTLRNEGRIIADHLGLDFIDET